MVGMGGEAEKLRGLFWRKPVWILEIPPKSSFKLFFFFLMWMIFWLRGTWDLDTLTRDLTYVPALKVDVLTIALPGKSLIHLFLHSPQGTFVQQKGCVETVRMFH